MITREKFKRRVIGICFPDKEYTQEFLKSFKITIGILLSVVGIKNNASLSEEICIDMGIDKINIGLGNSDEGLNYKQDFSSFKIVKKNFKECTDDDQSDETIEKLYELIK